jgi:hypothetical protein
MVSCLKINTVPRLTGDGHAHVADMVSCLMANMVACMTGAKHGAMRNYPCLTGGQQHCPCRKVGEKIYVFRKRIFSVRYILCETVALSVLPSEF